MNKIARKNRLSIRMTIVIISSAAIAAALYLSLSAAAYNALDAVFLKPELISEQERKCIANLQDYAKSKDISMNDAAALHQWVSGQGNLLLTLYSEGGVIFSSDENIVVPLPKDNVKVQGEDGFIYADYQVRFSDGVARAVLTTFFEDRYYRWATIACGIIAILVFMLIPFIFVRRKMRYIAMLESELKILKGGDLDYSITLLGNDELTSLAREVDAMRNAIKERQEQEVQYQRSSRELVTAMSHDLRTPLTSLIGYIDILYMNKCGDEARKKRYFEALRDKAYQIKGMSDKLFEYFIVFGKDEAPMEMELVNSVEFLGQVVEESLFDLESRGFTICRSESEVQGQLSVNVDAMRRIFGNIFSNLIKYADKAAPVHVEYSQQANHLLIRFTNRIGSMTAAESSGIGLKSCQAIMKQHSGTFHYEKKDQDFLVELSLLTQ